MGCSSSSSTRVHPVPQERSEQSQLVSSSPPTEAITTPAAKEPEQLAVEELDSVSPDKEADIPKPLVPEDGLVVEDIGDEPESSPTKEPLPTRKGDNVFMKVGSVHSLEDCAPSALEDSPASPELDVTMVNSPLPLAVGDRDEGAELKSASASIVRDNDNMDLRATHSHADMDKKSLPKKVDSEPMIESVVPADPTPVNDADATPPDVNAVPPEATPSDTNATHPEATPSDTNATHPTEGESPVKEDNNSIEEPTTDKAEPAVQVTNASRHWSLVRKSILDKGNVISTAQDPIPNEDPPDKKPVLADTAEEKDRPSPTLSKKTEDSDSRQIDNNTGQSSSVELGNTETTPTPVVQEVPATV